MTGTTAVSIIPEGLSKRQFNRLMRDREKQRLIDLVERTGGGTRDILLELIKAAASNPEVLYILMIPVITLLMKAKVLDPVIAGSIIGTLLVMAGVETIGSVLNPFD